MKTFIFLLILIIGLYYVIFTQTEDAPAAAQREQIDMPAPTPTPTLEAIETIGEDENHVSAQAAERSPKSVPTTSSTPANSHSLPAIEEDMTFLQLKSIIHTINPHYPQQRITLNSSIASLLPTQAARERFAKEISAQFSISEHDALSALGQKRLLWDWVNLFRE